VRFASRIAISCDCSSITSARVIACSQHDAWSASSISASDGDQRHTVALWLSTRSLRASQS
jgi:hypothetical protein